jgi:hypothetical protein
MSAEKLALYAAHAPACSASFARICSPLAQLIWLA